MFSWMVSRRTRPQKRTVIENFGFDCRRRIKTCCATFICRGIVDRLNLPLQYDFIIENNVWKPLRNFTLYSWNFPFEYSKYTDINSVILDLVVDLVHSSFAPIYSFWVFANPSQTRTTHQRHDSVYKRHGHHIICGQSCGYWHRQRLQSAVQVGEAMERIRFR